MGDATVGARRWTRLEYERLVEREVLEPGHRVELIGGHPARPVLVVEVSLSRLAFDREHQGRLYARAGIEDYWIVSLPERRLEVYREPVADAASPFGWRYGRVVTLDPERRVAPLAAPAAAVAVADLLP